MKNSKERSEEMYHAPEHNFYYGSRPPGVSPLGHLDAAHFPGPAPRGLTWYDPCAGHLRGFSLDEATGSYLGGSLSLYPRHRFSQF